MPGVMGWLKQEADVTRRELGNKEFNSNDTRGPKSVSAFIVKLSELTPRLIIKQMTLLAKQLDSEVRRFLIPFSRLILNYLRSHIPSDAL